MYALNLIFLQAFCFILLAGDAAKEKALSRPKYCTQPSPKNIIVQEKNISIQHTANVNATHEADIVNADCAVVVWINSRSIDVVISGNGLDGNYTVTQFHFHGPPECKPYNTSATMYVVLNKTDCNNNAAGDPNYKSKLVFLRLKVDIDNGKPNPIFNNVGKGGIQLSSWLPKNIKDCYFGEAFNLDNKENINFIFCRNSIFRISSNQCKKMKIFKGSY